MKRRIRISLFAVSVLAFGAVESTLAAPDSAETAVTGSAELWASVSTLSVAASSTQAAKAGDNPPPEKTPHTAEPPTGGHANLAAAATNPIANLVQFQVQDAYNWKNHNSEGFSNVATMQMVAPIALSSKKVPLMITRTTLPYVTTPDLGAPVGRQRDIGDTNVLALGLPTLKTKGVQMGFGINTSIPTAGSSFTGSGKWEAGPAAIYINMRTPSVQWGMMVYQLWSIASTTAGANRPGVSKLSIQPFIIKHFKKGWYAGTPDTPQTYDFKSNKWTWALGGQVGRVMKIGHQPVKLFGEILYNPSKNNGPTAKWTAKANLTFLFPE